MPNPAIAHPDALGSLDGLVAQVENARRAFTETWIAGEDLVTEEDERAYPDSAEIMRKGAVNFFRALSLIEMEVSFIRTCLADLAPETKSTEAAK